MHDDQPQDGQHPSTRRPLLLVMGVVFVVALVIAVLLRSA